MTILEEVRHSLILIEHDPLLYENAQKMTKNADRVFYFGVRPADEGRCNNSGK